jgi:predicted DNA-binding protein (UPF0251 family)
MWRKTRIEDLSQDYALKIDEIECLRIMDQEKINDQ